MLNCLHTCERPDSTCTTTPADDDFGSTKVAHKQEPKQESLLETLCSSDDGDEEKNDEKEVEDDNNEEESGVMHEADHGLPLHKHEQYKRSSTMNLLPNSGAQQQHQKQQHSRLLAAIQRKDWDRVLLFLRTGRWRITRSRFFQNDFAHLRDPHHRDQCRIWCCADNDGVRRLPLHVAILNGAPAVVLECLLDQYNGAIKCVDSSNLLPLELALMVDTTSDEAFLSLLEAWPPALTKAMNNKSTLLQQKNQQSQSLLSSRLLLPNGCGSGCGADEVSEELSHSTRYQYMSIIVEQSANDARHRIEEEWKTIVKEAGVEVGATDHLESVLTMLLHDRTCWQEQQQQQMVADALRRNAAKPLPWWALLYHRRRRRHRHEAEAIQRERPEAAPCGTGC